MNQSFMKERPILPLVLAMSVPNVLSMLVGSLYNIVDSLFVARISEDAMTALSLVFPLQNISLALGVGFGIGMNAVIAFFLGKKEEENANRAATTGLVFCFLHGLILAIAAILVMPRFLRSFTDDPSILAMGMKYSFIVFLFCAPHQLYIGYEKVFQAMGRMKTSMFAMMAGCITNIILDPIMIFGLGPVPAMGIAGAAWATGIGQTTSLMIYVVIYLTQKLPVRIGRNYIRCTRDTLGKTYAIGIPATLTMAFPSLLISTLNRILSGYSQLYIVVLGIYYRLQTFVYMPANGIIQGIRPLVGYNYGAGETERVKKIYRTALCLTACVTGVGTLVCLAFPETLVSLFSDNPETIRAGAAAFRIIAFGFVPSAVSITSCGALEGLGMGFQSMIISLLRYIALILPIAYLLSRLIGVTGVWHAFWITELLTAGAAFILYRYVFKKAISRTEE